MLAADEVGSHALLQRLWSLPGLEVYQEGWTLEHRGVPLANLRHYAGDWLAHYGRLSQPQLGELATWGAAQQEALERLIGAILALGPEDAADPAESSKADTSAGAGR